MVRECRPPARKPGRSWLARRSTMATSTPAYASSPANISPVGPPPAITTACSVIATLRLASHRSPPTHHIPRQPRRPCRTSRQPPVTMTEALVRSMNSSSFQLEAEPSQTRRERLVGFPRSVCPNTLLHYYHRNSRWRPLSAAPGTTSILLLASIFFSKD